MRLPLVHYEDRVEPFWKLGVSLDGVSIRGPLQKLDLCQGTTISWDLDFVELNDTFVPRFYCLVFTKRTEKNLNYGGSTSRNPLDEQDNGVFSLAVRDRLRMFRYFKHGICPYISDIMEFQYFWSWLKLLLHSLWNVLWPNFKIGTFHVAQLWCQADSLPSFLFPLPTSTTFLMCLPLLTPYLT